MSHFVCCSSYFSYAQVLKNKYLSAHKHGYIFWSLIDKTAIKADLESL
jgi:hypothetical protein